MITELLPSVYRLESVLGGRLLYQYLLVGARCVLIDTGINTTPREVILPALAQLGVAPERLALVVVTHCDLDHQGGNRAIKAACAGALLSCGRLDHDLVADPATLFARRYDAYRAEHAIAYDEATKTSILEQCDAPQPLDLTWTGGETYTIEPGWEIEILHVPGHSHGHLAVYDRRSRAVYTGDAVHGAYYPAATDGAPALPPTYLYVDAYLATIRALELLEVEVLAGDHWPVQRGPQVASFLAESRRFVEASEAAILKELSGSPRPLTLRQLLERVGPRLGAWPATVNSELVYAFAGHIEHLLAQGRLVQVSATRPAEYTVGY
jgi:glyoxylase-like metal-dependent hydrolase (beta-lactamase superfamily II)